MSLEIPVATIDIGATVLDIGDAWKYRDPEMTAKSFRGLLEGVDVKNRNRTVVHSPYRNQILIQGKKEYHKNFCSKPRLLFPPRRF